MTTQDKNDIKELYEKIETDNNIIRLRIETMITMFISFLTANKFEVDTEKNNQNIENIQKQMMSGMGMPPIFNPMMSGMNGLGAFGSTPNPMMSGMGMPNPMMSGMGMPNMFNHMKNMKEFMNNESSNVENKQNNAAFDYISNEGKNGFINCLSYLMEKLNKLFIGGISNPKPLTKSQYESVFAENEYNIKNLFKSYEDYLNKAKSYWDIRCIIEQILTNAYRYILYGE